MFFMSFAKEKNNIVQKDYDVFINGSCVCTGHVVNKIVETDFGIIILFSKYEKTPNNVSAYSKTGEKLWDINDILKSENPKSCWDIDVIDHKTLKITSSGTVYVIDIENKVLVIKEY